jgi:hypothetical protein
LADLDMSNLNSMSYEEFGRLRFLDFFPRTLAYEEDDIGGIDYGTGYACKAGYTSTLFARSEQRNETCVILLEFGDDCPEEEGYALLASLGLNLRKGMSHEHVVSTLGAPERDSPRFVRFVVGDKSPYYVGCSVDDRKGLFRVWIARKDLVDKNEQAV